MAYLTAFVLLFNYKQTLNGAMERIEGVVELKRSAALKFYLALFVVCIIAYQRKLTTIDNFFINPLYIGSMLLGILLVFKSLGYSCKKCLKNQIILGCYKYRLPTAKCYKCGYDIDNNHP